MKTLFCLILLGTAAARADETADREAIVRAVASLAAVFNAMPEFERPPWTETTPPRLVTRRIRFVRPDLAVVCAAETQYGSVMLVRRVPVLLLMRREPQGWRVAGLRLPADPVVLVPLEEIP